MTTGRTTVGRDEPIQLTSQTWSRTGQILIIPDRGIANSRMYIGDSTVTVPTGLYVPREGITIPTTNPALLYAISDRNNRQLTWMIL